MITSHLVEEKIVLIKDERVPRLRSPTYLRQNNWKIFGNQIGNQM